MLTVGAASKVINNEIGSVIQGASVNQVVKSVRDDLEANALYLKSGNTAVLLVSCDVAALLPEYAASFRCRMAAMCDVPERNIIIACSHTHAGPSVVPTNHFKEIDHAYHQRLEGWLAELAAAAADASMEGVSRSITKISGTSTIVIRSPCGSIPL